MFVTFENEEGYQRALHVEELIKTNPKYAFFQTMLGKEIQIVPASEPSDIIWENRGISNYERFVKKIVVFMTVGVLLFLSFIIIFKCVKFQNGLVAKYP